MGQTLLARAFAVPSSYGLGKVRVLESCILLKEPYLESCMLSAWQRCRAPGELHSLSMAAVHALHARCQQLVLTLRKFARWPDCEDQK